MPGADNLGGLVYQQRYLHCRVLCQVAFEATHGKSVTRRLVRFSIEGWIGDLGPVWDIVLEFSDGTLEFNECKDTAITKADRLVFYDRLRRQIASGTPVENILPVWVTDPDKQTPNALQYLEGIAANIGNISLSQLTAKPPLRMDSTEVAIREAVYRLCHFAGESDESPSADDKNSPSKTTNKPKLQWPRPCTLDEAKTVLKNLRVVRHRFAELDQSIQLLSTGVFVTGTAASLKTYVTGVLTEQVVNAGKADFKIDDFLQAIGTTALEQGLDGHLRELMLFSAASGLCPAVRRVVWRNLPNAPVTEWSLTERISSYETACSICLLADMGIGKSVTSQLSFEQQAKQYHPSRTLRLEVRSLDETHLNALLKLCCMLCGVGPTWLAIDGMDEAPNHMREQWIRVLTTLVSLPNLTLLVTVRTEVFVVHEWLVDAVSRLPKVELHPLSTQQVEQAFEGVGLPIPNNRHLVSALCNPFLLSLYADIVTPADMPLAQSGEVTAFRVVDEFWKRRVRGVSVGQRAVGDSAFSQEPKRKAAVYLGEQTLAGALVISRNGLDPEVAQGVEMLLREGVLREQGAAAVVWTHDWLREYALIETIWAKIDFFSATTLANAIPKICKVDHVARTAAAAGLKWILANPALGTAIEFLTQLASHDIGLAKEALMVLLEATPTPNTLDQLSEELLAEAVTLAVSLRVPHWKDQVAALDENRFLGPIGDRLHAITVEFELRIATGGASPSAETVRRLTTRDLMRWEANRPSFLGTAALLLENIIATNAHEDPKVQEWLLRLGGASDQYFFPKIRDAIAGLLTAGAVDLANKLYCSTIGFRDCERGAIIAKSLVERRSSFYRDLVDIIHSPNLLQNNVASWGRTSIEFLAKLIEVRQRNSGPSIRRFAKALGVKVDDKESFTPNYEEDARVTTLDTHDDDHPFVRLRIAIEQALASLAEQDDSLEFQALTEIAIQTGYAAILTIPLLVLYDAVSQPVTRRDWHETEIVRLLSAKHIMHLNSLHDVRRLLRQRLPRQLDHQSKDRLADAIRQAPILPNLRIRELSDLRDWNTLTSHDMESIALALEKDELRSAVDPRTEPLFHSGRGPIPTQPRSGQAWPYPEDEDCVRLLQCCLKSSNTSELLGPDSSEISLQIQALNTILARPEAKTERWIGTVLAWCNAIVRTLRNHMESTDQLGQGLTPQSWEQMLGAHVPWWLEMSNLALSSLASPVPDYHVNKPLERTLSWNSGDPILHAADFLDAVLAIQSKHPFADLQLRLVNTIVHQWKIWPSYTKVTVLSSLRTLFVAQSPALRGLLIETLNSESDPVLVLYAVEPLLNIAQTSPAPELAHLLDRANFGGLNDVLARVAQFLGDAYIQNLLQSDSRSLQKTSNLLDNALICNWPDRQALMHFLRGVLLGAGETLRKLTIEEKFQVYEGWLQLVELVVELWPFSPGNGDDTDWFSLHLITQALETEPSVEMRSHLFVRLTKIFETILQHGELAAFCQLHFDLMRLIMGGHSPICGKVERLQGIVIAEGTELSFVILCRASIERVVTWYEQGATTNDFGWVTGLRGEDSVKLIESCISVSQNRGRLKQELLPLVDLLANAGQQKRASDLRVFIRNA